MTKSLMEVNASHPPEVYVLQEKHTSVSPEEADAYEPFDRKALIPIRATPKLMKIEPLEDDLELHQILLQAH